MATKVATSKDFLTGVTGDTLCAVLSLVNEVVYTVKAVIEKLGLGKSRINPEYDNHFTLTTC